MADVEVKTYISKNGEKINRVNHFSSSYYTVSLSTDDGIREITPRLNVAEIDEENEVIFCQKNFMINNETLCNMYFYVNFKGELISLAFTNLNEGLFPIELTSENDDYPFETFDKSVETIKEKYASIFSNRVKRNTELSRKLALVKRVK